MSQKFELVRKQRKKDEVKALITELELCAVGMRDVLCQIFKEQLKAYDINCTRDLFIRSTAESDFLKMIIFLLKGNKALPQSKLNKAVLSLSTSIQEAFVEQVKGLDTGMKKLLDEVSRLNIRIAFISQFLSEELTRKFACKLHLPSNALYVPFPYGNDTYLNINRWLKLAKDIKVSPHNCFAIVSCAKSCRSALSAGIPCAAVVDECTAWHDLSGADITLQSLSNTDINDLLTFLLQERIGKK